MNHLPALIFLRVGFVIAENTIAEIEGPKAPIRIKMEAVSLFSILALATSPSNVHVNRNVKIKNKVSSWWITHSISRAFWRPTNSESEGCILKRSFSHVNPYFSKEYLVNRRMG